MTPKTLWDIISEVMELDRKNLLALVEAAEIVQSKIETRAETAKLGAAVGFGLDQATSTLEFTKDYFALLRQLRLIRIVKNEVIGRIQQSNWSGIPAEEIQ